MKLIAPPQLLSALIKDRPPEYLKGCEAAMDGKPKNNPHHPQFSYVEFNDWNLGYDDYTRFKTLLQIK